MVIVPNKETYYKNFFNNVTEENMLSIGSILSKNDISRINLLEKLIFINKITLDTIKNLSESKIEFNLD